MDPRQIVSFAQELKKYYHTTNPYVIAKAYGIRIQEGSRIPSFKAHTLKLKNYPTIISINSRYSPLSRVVLCAHELGHALLHDGFVNTFDVTRKNMHSNVEYEANLFAVSLLCEEETFCLPIHKMTNVQLKQILDANIELG